MASIYTIGCAALGALCALGNASFAHAQTRTPFEVSGEGVQSRYVQQLRIDVTEKDEKIFIRYWGMSESSASGNGARRGTFRGTSRITGGTGRFAKLRGVTVDVAEFDTDTRTGYYRANMKGEYWFER